MRGISFCNCNDAPALGLYSMHLRHESRHSCSIASAPTSITPSPAPLTTTTAMHAPRICADAISRSTVGPSEGAETWFSAFQKYVTYT